jgi:hypothetical protein
MRATNCYSTSEFGIPISLIQNGKDNFTVIYGLQVDKNLNYANAAAKLGQAFMHALACDDKLDNRMKGER